MMHDHAVYENGRYVVEKAAGGSGIYEVYDKKERKYFKSIFDNEAAAVGFVENITKIDGIKEEM